MKYRIVLGDKEYCVDVSDNGVCCEAEVEKENIEMSDMVKEVSMEDILPDFHFIDDNNTETIYSPMQGKILNIIVKNGQIVKKGEKIASLESMKMEISISSNVDGFIRDINIHEGDFVKNNQELFVVKRET
ncbi:biotin-dependent enzyme [Kineothrix alysoides]|uniref:Biotin-dependent enzyme n=1 Tax=Kineothrix alysoides TaxID=1469948 RepID=A0A4R1QW55_9FIRM|nr:acetyl-CoA carboxylase biotin carboxyl carrier protein subunit [Kineothrix alysoides]TCL57583.1 biotin-dependent enzyme [Kineothrix alysoides]